MTPDGIVLLEGDCSLEDAEPLLRLLAEAPTPPVDWRNCETAHAAVIQVLLAARPVLNGPPRGLFLSGLVEPALNAR